jgi:thiamine biosynthesis lipoprotein
MILEGNPIKIAWMSSTPHTFRNASLVKVALAWLLLLSLLLGLSGCRNQHSQWVSLSGATMGTYYVVKYLNRPHLASPKIVQQALDQRLERLNDLMSTYRPDSELSRFNRSPAVHQLFPLAPETMRVIREAVRLHQLSEGALDITLGPLVDLWGFGPTAPLQERLPTPQALTQHLAWVGLEQLGVHLTGISKAIPQLALDLSGIAKGFGVDELAEYLASLGIDHYLVGIGGEIRFKGHNPQRQPWRIAIENPTDPSQPASRLITPGEGALATSGDYRNYFEQDGIRYSHTLDPRSGQPITHQLISATVLHPSCMTADGLATAFSVLGPEKALAIANQHQIPLLLLIKTPTGFTEHYSVAFQPYLKPRSS